MVKNTFTEFEFEDGSKTQLTIAFYFLYQLKTKNKKVYDEYNRIMAEGVKEELDATFVLYTAYLCAAIANGEFENAMSYEDFLMKCGNARKPVTTAVRMLIKPKN